MKSDSSTTTSVGKQHFAGLIENGFITGTQRFYTDNASFVVQTGSHNNDSRFNWFRIEALDNDTTSNRISMYNRKYTWKNGRPGTGRNIHIWDNGVPSFMPISRSLIDSLPLASVVIDAAGNNLTIDNLGNLDFITNGGTGTVHLDDDNFNVEAATEITLTNQQDASLTLNSAANIEATNTEGVIGFKTGGEQWLWHYVNDDADADTAMTLYTVDDKAYLRLHDYGNGNMDFNLVGEYVGKYIPAFTPTGKVLDYRLARDTFIEDVTLFSVGVLMYSCQELTIVSSMTATAPSNMEIRFPDAAEELRGKKIIVYSKKRDAGVFIPEIKMVGGVSRLFFTTNPGIGGTDPSNQSVLQIDDTTWSDHGTTFEFTCLKIDNTPSYRWVLKQR